MTNPSTRQHPSARDERHPFRAPAHRAPAGVEDARPAGGPSARARVTAAAGLNVLAGIWLIIAPFVLGYSDGDPYWNDIVFGAVVLVIAAGRMVAGARLAWLSALNMLVGAWIFASAFWLDQSATASWNDAILGAIVFLLGAIAASVAAGRRTEGAR